ncbi:MAG TPA: hypothetical protein DCE78_00575, partial [Bacteroidetes bacterium]|nr:hypothetical protein [Bacteroidota bacterium]
MKKILFLFAILLVSVHQLDAQGGLDTLQLKTIFDEPYLPGVRPSVTAFHPNNKTVFINWNDSSFSENKIFQVDLDGKNFVLAPENSNMFRSANLSPDKKLMLFNERGELMIANTDGSNKRVLVSTPGSDSNGNWSSTGRLVAYQSQGDVWIIDIQQAQVRQITNRGENDPFYNIRGWAKDDSLLVVSQTNSSENREVFFPEYIDKFVKAGGSRRGVSTISLQLLDVHTRKSETLLTGKISLRGTVVSPSGRYLVVDQADEFLKNREIGVYDLKNANSYNSIFQDSTEGWISSSTGDIRFAPEQDLFMFTSEKDGWNHIYLVEPTGARFRQLTSGNYEVSWN